MLKLIKAAPVAGFMAFFAVSAVYALNVDQTRIVPARTCQVGQNVCYYRLTINYNDPRIGTGQWFGTLPQNAYILRIDADVTTAFNAATTNLLTLGATAASANEIVADCSTATACISDHTTTIAAGISHLTTAAGLALAITGNTTYQTALNGAVPLYAKYAQTGTAASTGSVTFVIEYTKNDDM